MVVIEVWDKTPRRLGTIGNPESVSVNVRHNQQSSAQIIIPAAHRLTSAIATPGARVRIFRDGVLLLSGPVAGVQGAGPRDQATLTVQVTDWWYLLRGILGWPVPGASIGNQSTAEYATYAGPAETVVKSIVSANLVGRRGLPVDVTPTTGQGANVAVTSRFHPIADRIFPAVDDAGIGTRIWQQDNGRLRFDTYTPTLRATPLTESSGVVVDWSWSQSRPEASRVVIGGKGEGTARVFDLYTDPSADALWGVGLGEDFLDATDVDTQTQRLARGRERSLELAETAGMSVTLSETPHFRYDPTGVKGIRVGDHVRFEVGTGVVVEDILRSVTLSWSVSDGPRVTPQVGERTDDHAMNIRRDLARIVRALRQRRT